MNHEVTLTDKYTALTIVSEMMFGEDKKDQDRARWYGPGQIACVCDGVSSSPCSAQSAETVISHAPILFKGNNDDTLKMVCELLMALREEYRQSELVFPDGTSSAMQDILRPVIQEKRASSFQTTLMAMQIACHEKTVLTRILKCGDSAFFAFSHKGELLSSSLTQGPDHNPATQNKRHHRSSSLEATGFGPGDQILVRVEGLLASDDTLAQETQIRTKHRKNWLVCTPIEVCSRNTHAVVKTPSGVCGLSLRPADRLLVPKYLYGTTLTSNGQRYRVLDYSSTLRVLSADAAGVSHSRIAQRGTTTKVLPDHYYRGCVESYQDTFPLGTHFVLCSDGFYGCFSDARLMWRWLRDHARALSHKDERQPVLARLHRMLSAKSGDDDISFVWACPR